MNPAGPNRSPAAAPFTLALLAWLSGGGPGCSQPAAGLRVNVDVGAFGPAAASLEIAVSALPGGFQVKDPFNAGGAMVTTQDYDGDGALDLVTRFLGPFPGPFSFQIDTGNGADLNVQAHAVAFDATSIIAGADKSITLPAGGSAQLTLALTARDGGQVGPGTRTTDLGTASADLTVDGAHENGHLSALAVCDLDHDGADDLIIGAPDADDTRALGGVGAVYVVFGGAPSGTTIDLASAQSGQELHFYGLNGGDHLGAAVACADLDNDGYADLIAGAPGGTDGAGNVYAVFGGANLPHNRTIDLGSTTQQPDIHWQTSVAGANLGSALYAGDLDGDHHAELLISAPGAQKVHLFTAAARTAAAIDVELPDHVTFTGLAASALGAGDVNGDTADARAPLDIILGDPGYRKPTETGLRGAVYVFSAVAPAATTQYSVGGAGALGPAVTMVGDLTSQFGTSVLAFDSGRGQDLLVGAPGDGSGTGAVFLYENDSSFFVAPMRDSSIRGKTITGPIAGGRFGAALALAASGSASSGGARLIVGAPAATVGSGRAQAGAAYMFQGAADRTFPLLDQLFGHSASDQLGAAVAGGKVSGGDMIGDLVAAAPFATGAKAGSGVVYVRFGQ